MTGYAKYPMRRHDDQVPPVRAVVGVVVLITLTIAAMLWFTKRVEGGATRHTPYPSHDSLGPTYLYDGKDVIRWYVFTDPDTGQQYLVNDRGGCTPRVKGDPNEPSD